MTRGSAGGDAESSGAAKERGSLVDWVRQLFVGVGLSPPSSASAQEGTTSHAGAQQEVGESHEKELQAAAERAAAEEAAAGLHVADMSAEERDWLLRIYHNYAHRTEGKLCRVSSCSDSEISGISEGFISGASAANGDSTAAQAEKGSQQGLAQATEVNSQGEGGRQESVAA